MDRKKFFYLLKKGEGTKLDFKLKLDLITESGKKEIAKDVSAIANSRGGRGYIFVGIEDKTKHIIGIKAEDFTEEQIQQIVTSRCEPPIPISLELLEITGKEVGIINIYNSGQRPYQLRETGGFHIRRGSTTDIMRSQELVSAFLESINLNLELFPVIKSDISCLSMDLVYRYFKKQGIEIAEDNKLLLMEHASIISLDKESSEYCVTLGGLLIFSRTNNIYIPHNMIRIINRIHKGMDEISIVKGDLLSILDESEEILKKILPKNYPVDAVNEGIKNAVVYRDYTMFHREIEIMINTSGISITSPGIIASGRDINPQSYYRRNMWLYEKLIYLDPKERFLKAGKGFTKIRKAFKNHGKVLFINSLEEDYFKIVYPPINIFNAPKIY